MFLLGSCPTTPEATRKNNFYFWIMQGLNVQSAKIREYDQSTPLVSQQRSTLLKHLIDTNLQTRNIVATLVLIHDANGDLHDSEGHLHNVADQKIDDQGTVIPDQEIAILEAANAKNAAAVARDAATDTAQAVQPRR